MITVNDKLKLFTKRIIETKQKEYDEKVAKLEGEMLSEFAERKETLLRDRVKYETSLLKGIKSERDQRLSNARSEKKRRLLLKRKEMIDSLIEGVKKYTIEFTNSDEYEKYLINTVKENINLIRTMDEFILYLREEDYLKYKDILRKLLLDGGIDLNKFLINKYDSKILGGLVMIKKDGSTRLDLSLDAVIVENREYMGRLIYKILEEAGETNVK